jgi:uncharacterized protein YijF (DUF1287 family)
VGKVMDVMEFDIDHGRIQELKNFFDRTKKVEKEELKEVSIL